MRCKRARVRSFWAAPLVCAMLSVTSQAQAQAQKGPVVVGGRPSLPMVSVDPITGNVNVDYYYEHDTTKQNGQTVGTTDDRVQETVNVLTHGYILSPNFIDLSLGGLIGLQQESFSEPGNTRSTNGVLDGWNVSGTILRNQPAPLTLYTRRSETILTPDFSPSLDSITTSSGGTLDIHSNVAPTQLQFYREDDKQTQAGDVLNYELSQDVASWHTDVISLPHQTLSWDANYQNTTEQENNSPSIHYVNYSASLNHVLTFGPQDAHSLTSSLYLFDQTGDLGYSEQHLDETMRLQHTPNFQTHYNYTLDHTSIEGIEQTQNSLDAGFIHHLFESLTTTGDVGGSLFNESGGANVEQYFGTLNFAYRKRIPDGLLLSGLNLGYQWQESSAGNQVTHVLNQAFTFTDPQPLVLTQINIDPKSIVVLSPGGVPYLSGHDFTVNRVGNLIQVERVIGGLIPPDGTVKLDYNLLPQPANTQNTRTLGFNTRYEIDQGPLTGLSPYVRYGIQRQSIQSDNSGDFVPDSYNDLTVGSDYHIWKLQFNAEQQWHDSTLVPFNASRFSARYVDRFSRDTTASLTGSFAYIDYYGEKDIVDDASITAAVQKKLNTEWSLNARAIWLNDRDQLFGNTQALEEQLELDWSHNQTTVFGRIRNATLSSSSERNTFQVFELGFTRSF